MKCNFLRFKNKIIRNTKIKCKGIFYLKLPLDKMAGVTVREFEKNLTKSEDEENRFQIVFVPETF
jgi:hypothetical protein